MSTGEQGEFLARQALRQLDVSDKVLQQLVTYLVRATVEGHSSVRLDRFAAEEQTAVDLTGLTSLLAKQDFVGEPGERDTPLILDSNSRLYLARYWHYERAVADALIERASQVLPSPAAGADMAAGLSRLFPQTEEADQKTAVAVAALRPLTIISGGPGTGKTTTVTRLLSLLMSGQPDARVALAAPTGKAAARVSESIRSASQQLPGDVAQRLPTDAVTVHRLLGVRPATNRCHYDKDRQLPYDIVVIDEGSMIGVALMSRLLAALPLSSRLIILGDKDQLDSVDPGSVLSDICSDTTGFSSDFATRLAGLGVQVESRPTLSRLQDCVVELRHSYRYQAGGGIGRLAQAIQRGKAGEAMAALENNDQVRLVEDTDEQDRVLREQVRNGYSDYASAVRGGAGPLQQLDAFDRFRFLCAYRHGPTGVERINQIVRQALASEGLVETSREWGPGVPVLVKRNDYTAKLFNGDIGIVTETDDGLRVAFPGSDGVARLFPLSRLPEHELVYAMTVHKSQGSEFNRVVLVLPDEDKGLLSRELIYTALTRARQGVVILGQRALLEKALARQRLKSSGLAAMLACADRSPASPQQGSFGF
ncbi:MAG: exodeoxyribonuclease V subunit alpha [Gammaproteobacteria bacterium]|nr:exodeoxyribonuclease V subunit alpha [Gammaproteobacteria bacterium]